MGSRESKAAQHSSTGTLKGTPNREPQECTRNVIEHKDPGRCIPIMFLHSWGPSLGSIKVPLSSQ